MKAFATEFYSSKAWQDCREYIRSRDAGLCQLCLKNGIYNAGEIVHHKTEITPANINDPSITLNPDNLILVCRDHHAELHGHTTEAPRYEIDPYTGKVKVLTEDERKNHNDRKYKHNYGKRS